MDEKQLTDIVTREVITKISTGKIKVLPSPAKFLGVLTHPGKGVKLLSDSLLQVARENIPVLAWVSEAVDELTNLTAKSSGIRNIKVVNIDKEKVVLPDTANLDKIIAGAFSFELADRIIGLKDMDPVVNVLIQGLLNGIPVHVFTPFPLADRKTESSLTGKMNRELHSRLDALTEMGIVLLDEIDLKDKYSVFTSTVPDLITEASIDEMHGKINELKITKSVIITPLALEKAREYNIRIIRV